MLRMIKKIGKELVASAGYVRLLCNSLMLRGNGLGETITMIGAYGSSEEKFVRNIGDNAILLSMLKTFETLNTKLLIGVIDEEGSYSRWGKEFKRKKTWGDSEYWSNIVNQTKVLVFGGGGLFQDYGNSWKAPTKILLTMLPFWIAGKPIMWYSIGVGPLVTLLGRRSTRYAAKISDVITLRDRDSAVVLKQIGVDEKKVLVTADTVFSMKMKRDNIARDNETIGLALCPFYKVVYNDEKKNEIFVKESTAIVNRLTENGWRVKLYSFHTKTDHELNKEIVEKCNKRERVEMVRNDINVEEMIDEYSSLRALIGMRFHSIVFSIITSTPVVIIPYHPKVRSFSIENGLTKAMVPMENYEYEYIKEKLDVVLKEKKKGELRAEKISNACMRKMEINKNALIKLLNYNEK